VRHRTALPRRVCQDRRRGRAVAPNQSLCTLTTQTNRIKSGAGRSRSPAPSTTDPHPYVRIPRDG
jgi:hypothetical protein